MRLSDSETADVVSGERLRSLEEKSKIEAAEAEVQIVALKEQVRAFGTAAQEVREKVVAAEATAAVAQAEARRLHEALTAALQGKEASRVSECVALTPA